MVQFSVTHSECLKWLKTLKDESYDSVVTDPPSGTGFMHLHWDTPKEARLLYQDDIEESESVDHGATLGDREIFVNFITAVFKEVYRVLKPGAYGLVWALPRTSHWTAWGLEDAGFYVSDIISHIFSSGFPKNHNIGKAIDKIMGQESEVIGVAADFARDGASHSTDGSNMKPHGGHGGHGYGDRRSAPVPDEGKEYAGKGNAIKPSHENWILIRKPLDGTIAGNVLKHGTGGLNIDACRVKYEKGDKLKGKAIAHGSNSLFDNTNRKTCDVAIPANSIGRWPPNTIFSHGPDCTDLNCVEPCPVLELVSQNSQAKRCFPTFKYSAKPRRRERDYGLGKFTPKSSKEFNAGGIQGRRDKKSSEAIASGEVEFQGLGARGRVLVREDGSETLVKRFIPQYRANNHATIKGFDLMRWLCRLVTPEGGTVLDCFAGSGSTGCGAVLEGLNFEGCDQELEYVGISRARIAACVRKHETGLEPEEIDEGQIFLFE